MREIVPNFSSFEGLIAGRVYLIRDPDGLTIIDTSIAPSGPRIVRQIEAAGHPPSALRRILITHAHPDHVGGLNHVVAATGAEVWASQPEADVIEGRIAIPRAERSALHGLYKLFLPPTTWVKPPVKVSRILNEGDVLPVFGGLTVIATPGHAPGHVSFWNESLRLLITGDVVFHLFNRLTLPLAPLTVDMEQDKRSLRKLIALNPEIVCFGHGDPIMSNGTAALTTLADRVGA